MGGTLWELSKLMIFTKESNYHMFDDQQKWILVFMRFQLKYRIRKPLENKESWKIKQNGISALEVD